MFSDYYKNELRHLKEMGEEFSKTHPILAPMLKGPSADPDVERLLEGVAFLTANIKQKLDDEFPEILHSLVQIVCPHFLCPIPSVTMMVFQPKSNLKEVLRIPKGTYIDSLPVDGTTCRFRTCSDIDISPLTLVDAEIFNLTSEGNHSDQVEIKLTFSLHGINLSEWKTNNLRLYFSGDYHEASNRYFLLRHFLTSIAITTPNCDLPFTLEPNQIRPGGFEKEDAILPYPSNIFPSFRLIQEYFLFPEKFLFLDLNLSQWADRGDDVSFTISLVCNTPSFDLPNIHKEHFILFAVPAINLFDQDAEPKRMDQREAEILVRPSDMEPGSYQIHSIDQVSGILRGQTEKRIFTPFSGYNPVTTDTPVYHQVFRPSILDNVMDLYLSIAYSKDEIVTDSEVVSINLTCTNSFLPEALQAGDICKPTANTPELVTYQNICQPTTSHSPPLSGDLLYYLLSHLSTNYLSLSDTASLRKMLSLYILPGSRNKTKEIVNQKRINGILSVDMIPQERLINRMAYRGEAIHIKIKHDHFASPGDMFLFGSILDFFLGTHVSINTYTVLTFEDVLKGEYITWPTRLGTRPLI